MKNVKSWQIVSWIVVGFVLLLMAYQTFRPKTPMEVARVEAQRLEDRVQARRAESPPVPVASCSVADIVIVSTDGGFVDECRRSA